MTIVFYLTYGIWFASEFLISRLLKSGNTDQKGLDDNTLRLIWITVVVACSAAVTIGMSTYVPIAGSIWIRYIGLALILLGVVLRFMAIRSLGREFTVNVTIRQDHRIKTDGFYAYLRHPSYTFSLLSFIGLGLSLNNWISLIILVIAISVVFLRRIKVEEAALTEAFGTAYTDYAKRTYGLIPFVL